MYNPSKVRTSFRRKFCHEYQLPSGKYSGYFAYPISDDEVIAITSDYSDEEAPNYVGKTLFANISEWRLWTALRIKYGVNYMSQRKQVILPEMEAHEPEQEDPRDFIAAYVDKKFDDFICVYNEQMLKEYKEHMSHENAEPIDYRRFLDDEIIF